MFYQTLKWYHTLSSGWKTVAWIVVILAGLVSILVFFVPWILNSKFRDKIKKLQVEAAVSKAKYQIVEVNKKVKTLEQTSDEALKSEAQHALEEAAIDKELIKVADRLHKIKSKVKDQSDAQQGEFFNSRYHSDR